MILIVNADDFGMSPGVNRGIIQGHQAGVITSTSLMVRGEAVTQAVKLARENPRLGIGLHADLCEWEYRDGEWRVRYSVVPTDNFEEVAAELRRQLDLFRDLLGCNPTHVDSHQHVHRDRPARLAFTQAVRELNIPLRHFHPQIAYCGKFYGQSNKGDPYTVAISVDALVDIIRTLPERTTELACHPASAADMDSTYKDERLLELESLCDPRVRAAIAEKGVQLQSFRDFMEFQKPLGRNVS